jgi:hypothetical protein
VVPGREGWVLPGADHGEGCDLEVVGVVVPGED